MKAAYILSVSYTTLISEVLIADISLTECMYIGSCDFLNNNFKQETGYIIRSKTKNGSGQNGVPGPLPPLRQPLG